jgi:type I restriction-modification system DNA methylase subunit
MPVLDGGTRSRDRTPEQQPGPAMRICDPACGTGGCFLAALKLAALARLAESRQGIGVVDPV